MENQEKMKRREREGEEGNDVHLARLWGDRVRNGAEGTECLEGNRHSQLRQWQPLEALTPLPDTLDDSHGLVSEDFALPSVGLILTPRISRLVLSSSCPEIRWLPSAIPHRHLLG